MQKIVIGRCGTLTLALLCGSFAFATDYYVSTTGADANDGTTEETAFATVDKAVSAAVAGDVVYMLPGEYPTDAEWGPQVKCTLIGKGETRDDVVIKPGESKRTIRTTPTGVIRNLTIVGNSELMADKGGAVEMSGGSLVDCVIRDGKVTGQGGNIYAYDSQAVLIRNCHISGGSAGDNGGNVLLAGSGSVLEDSTISDGTIRSVKGKVGANVCMSNASRLSRCSLIGGVHEYEADPNAASLAVSYSGSARVEDCLVTGSSCGGVVLTATSHLYNMTIVGNKVYGLWAWSNVQYIYNSIVFGNQTVGGSSNNWAGNIPNGSSAQFWNNAIESGTKDFTAGRFPGLVLIDSSAFADYANADYRPSAGGALAEAGVSDPRRHDASETDIAGAPRTVGTIDIGCYEYQPETFYATFSAALGGFEHPGDEVVFTAYSANGEGDVTYSWDFGDGTDSVETTEPTVSHAYSTGCCLYTVKLTATSGSATFTQSRTDYVVVYDVVWVNADATPQIPYATKETGLTTLPAALAIHSGKTGEVRLAPGLYTVSSQQTISSAVTVSGMGETPDDVVVSNTATATSNSQYKRVFEVSHDGARIENLTMAGGRVYNQSGGNLRLGGGVVSNCVIRHGQITINGGNGGGGGVELAGHGILTHCWVTNNLVSGTAKDSWGAGGAVFISYGSKGRLDNTLIAYNTYVTSGDTPVRGSAGLQVGGDNDTAVIENCSIVSNVVQGAITTSAGVWSDSSWYTTFRNCVIAGNWQTASNAFSSATLTGYTKVYNCVADVAPNRTAFHANSTGFTLGDVKTMFKDFEGGDFTPRPGTILANRGVNPSYAAAVDLAGNPRVFGKAIDIGCYEAQQNSGLIIRIH